jgi:alcohol dehydrogenase class IV
MNRPLTLSTLLQDTPRNRHLVDALHRLVQTEVDIIISGGSNPDTAELIKMAAAYAELLRHEQRPADDVLSHMFVAGGLFERSRRTP